MEWNEFELHSARRQVIKLTGHLLDARKAFNLSTEHATLVAGHKSPTTNAIIENVLALLEGTTETIKLCAIAADQFKKQMKEPNAKPPPIGAECGKRLTPFQKMLAREGVKFDTLPKYEPTKAELKLPKMLKFTLKTPKPRKNRRKSADNPPL